MQQQITILQNYIDLGDCSTHLKQIRKVCTQPKCASNKYLCDECSNHKDHKVQSSQQHLDELTAKIISAQPNLKNNQAELYQSFMRLGNIVVQFQEQMTQTAQILKNINLREYTFYELAIGRSPETLSKEMCQWNIRENGATIQQIIQKLTKMNLDDPAAPASYKKWVQNIQKMVTRFMNTVARLREQAFTIEQLFNIEPVLKQMRKSKISSSDISPPKVIKADPPATVTITKIDLGGKKLISQQIIDEIVKHDTTILTSIDIQQNSLDAQGLHQLLNLDKKFPKLEQLILNDNCLENNSLDVILKANLPNLKLLNIKSNFFYDDENAIKKHELIAAKWPGLKFIT